MKNECQEFSLLGDHSYTILRQQRGWWVRSEKWQFLLIFSSIYADVLRMGGWVGGSEKVQKCADVI